MRGSLRYVAVAALGLATVGCVSQEKYAALKIERDGLAERLTKAESEAGAARAQAASWKQQLDTLLANGRGGEALTVNLQQQLADLQAQYNDLNAKYAEAIARTGQGGPLPQALSNELTTFAAQNPDLVEFDQARGMVKFKSDVTFAVGDAQLTPKAKEVIGRFSQILNSPAAGNYELIVAGHTDSTPVSNPRTIQAGHKNNWYLSAHRAISVGEALVSQKVSPKRIGVTGYADQRPVASNASESGKQQNRRVEVLILPTQVKDLTPVAPTAAERPTPRPAGRTPSASTNEPSK